MSLVRMESYTTNATSGQDLIPLIKANISDKTGKNISAPLALKHISIYAEDGDVFTINGFDFDAVDGIFASPILAQADAISIDTIIPKQSGEVKIFYIR